MIQGIAVDQEGNGHDPLHEVGSVVAPGGDHGLSKDAIKYYIPLLNDSKGVYGVTGITSCYQSGGGTVSGIAGTCRDRGTGYGYNDADALQMNIFFDLSGEPASKSASLSFEFDDLDLTPDNDPDGFFESISLSYWYLDGGDFKLESLSGTIKTTEPPTNGLPMLASTNLVTWDLDLLALGALNTSAADKKGFWIQLGFGSSYTGTGRNTPEYLAAQLTVSPVPVPAAFWLFGTALIGFVGMSRRTKIS